MKLEMKEIDGVRVTGIPDGSRIFTIETCCTKFVSSGWYMYFSECTMNQFLLTKTNITIQSLMKIERNYALTLFYLSFPLSYIFLNCEIKFILEH